MALGVVFGKNDINTNVNPLLLSSNHHHLFPTKINNSFGQMVATT